MSFIGHRPSPEMKLLPSCDYKYNDTRYRYNKISRFFALVRGLSSPVRLAGNPATWPSRDDVVTPAQQTPKKLKKKDDHRLSQLKAQPQYQKIPSNNESHWLTLCSISQNSGNAHSNKISILFAHHSHENLFLSSGCELFILPLISQSS